MTTSPLRLNLRDLRKLRGLSQAQLATAAGVTRATVNRIEKGHPKSVEFSVLSRLASALAVHPAMLFLSPDTSSSTADSSPTD